MLALPALITGDLGLGVPYFCKWICPAGTLEAAVPLYILYPPVRSGLGYLFAWRLFLLVLFLGFIILVKRGFCQAFCPLGAFYSFFNPFSFYRLSVDSSRCTGCHTCKKTCLAFRPENICRTAEIFCQQPGRRGVWNVGSRRRGAASGRDGRPA
ncbi:MAG: 4Fe-4S binding protein [Firmicutes bacterium]|nr:4Fe-4S binding protein [Bacillota bacterium]